MTVPAYNHTTDYHQVATTLTIAQDTTPFYRYLNGPTTDIPKDIANLERRTKQYADAGATIIEISNFSAVAIWELPGGKQVAPKFTPGEPLIRSEELQRHHDKIHKVFEEQSALFDHILNKKDHYHLSFISKRPDSQEKGIVSALVKPFLERALKEGKFAYLDAIDYHAVDVYKHWGFKVIKEWILEDGVAICFMVFNGDGIFKPIT